MSEYQPDSEDTRHSSVRGEEMSTGTEMTGQDEHAHIHCCACWRYTDDSRRSAELVRDATTIVCNGSTLAVENSDAFKAADQFLAARFKSAAFELTMTVKL